MPLLRNVLPYQSVEPKDNQSLYDQKLFTVIVLNCLDSRSEEFKSLDNGSTNLIRRLAIYFSHHCIAAFSFNQRDGGVLCPNNGLTFQIANLGATLNRFRSMSNGASVSDLASSIATAAII